MSAPAPPEEPTSLPGEGPAGLEVLQAGGGHGRGNALLLDREGGALLKVYRSRRGASGAWRELLRDLAHRRLEGKRGVGPEVRRETEREVLRLWRSEGFDVPAVLDLATPPGIEEPSLWLEYCDGRTLDRAIADCALEGRGAPADRADLLVARLAGEHGRRHRRALDRTEPLLVQEHPTIVHTLHCGDRLVTIDFENAWASGAPVPLVVARELAGTLRSFFRRLGRGSGAGEGGRAFDVFVEAYPEPALLREAALIITRGGGLVGALRRRRDRRRRNRPSKVEVMGWVLEGRGPARED